MATRADAADSALPSPRVTPTPTRTRMASEQQRLEDEVDAALAAAQQEQALRSRVQAVELRRRPSDDTDGAESHRSSLVSHHSLASAQSAPASDWLLRARKNNSARLKYPPIGGFDEDRSSLPTLDSYHAPEEASKAGVTPLADENNRSKRGAWRKKDRQSKGKSSSSARVFESKDASFDVYYAPQSPAPSTVHSAPRMRTKSGVSHVSERKGAVLTEVGSPTSRCKCSRRSRGGPTARARDSRARETETMTKVWKKESARRRRWTPCTTS